jgi:hypothetical protein
MGSPLRPCLTELKPRGDCIRRDATDFKLAKTARTDNEAEPRADTAST